ncbi:MAG: glycerate kinase [Defluviitaleaceae bacterium]|nr:glycerate kinase [Defluviitaleaceae bacterium]
MELQKLQKDANTIIENIIKENLPGKAVEKALKTHNFKSDKVYLVAIGKAAYTMAKAAANFLGDKLEKGIIVTKYDHAGEPIENIDIYEAGHPVADENSVKATEKCIELAESLTENDELVFLVSGGGSAIFEKPGEGVTLDDIIGVTDKLLKSSADIIEINMIRKRLSAVKAGRFAEIAAPAKVFAIILSDVLGDRLDTIASGPAVPDMSTSEDALDVLSKYNLEVSNVILENLKIETPKSITNVETVITGSVKTLIDSAANAASELGYKPYILTNTLNCEAKEAGRFLSTIANDTLRGDTHFEIPCAIIAGGETVVNIIGEGKGGRNQEKALSFAAGVSGQGGLLFFSLGSDGTDGPTDAAGGIVTGQTAIQLKERDIDINEVLKNNDSYNALKEVDSLIMTGPTGTNVNDVCVILID